MERKMKDSGIEWIGEIPEEWEMRKVKHYYTLQTGFTPDTKNESFYDDENGEDWVTISDLDGKRVIPSNTKSHISHNYICEFHPLKTPCGSLLYSFKLSVGQVAFTNRDIYTNEAIASFVNTKDNCLEFLFYSSFMIIENANENIYGAKILNQELIKNAYIIFPPIDVQREIAYFLDCECKKIDDIIDKTRASIEEYKKLKQSVITQAVTKGVRGNRKMKNLGIEWIGEIPEEWEDINPKALFSQRKDKAFEGERQLTASQQYGIVYQDEYMELTGSRVVTVEKDFDILKHVEKGDFVISMRSFQGGLEYSEKSGSISSAYVMLIPNLEKVFARYFRWLLKSEVYINALQSTSNMVRDGQAMRYSNFAQVRLLSVPLDEQKEIADYLDEKCNQIDGLIEQKTKLVFELESLKKSLIYEYVTGKKEVPATWQ